MLCLVSTNDGHPTDGNSANSEMSSWKNTPSRPAAWIAFGVSHLCNLVRCRNVATCRWCGSHRRSSTRLRKAQRFRSLCAHYPIIWNAWTDNKWTVIELQALPFRPIVSGFCCYDRYRVETLGKIYVENYYHTSMSLHKEINYKKKHVVLLSSNTPVGVVKCVM